MLKNYLLVALRNLRKNVTYSFINIAGLSIGIVCTLLIMLWVFDELSFDKFQPKADRLYQVYVNAAFDGKINTWNSVPQPTYEALKSEDSNITNTCISDWGGDHLYTVGDTRVNKKAYYVSEEFLEMFRFPMVKGDPATALDDPSSIVISESFARILFGDEDPINQTIRVNNARELKVTGVVKDIPKNSTFQFDCLMTWKMKIEAEDWVKRSITQWGNYSFQVYVELNEPANEERVESAIKDLLTRKGEVDIKREFFLHPMLRWRLHSTFENGKESGGMVDYVNMFTIIAAFVLVIACINFMNLATARSERRAREVGIRKSVGSRRYELIAQFMGESIFLALLAFAIAILFTHLLLPAYNQLVDKQLFIDYSSPVFWAFAVGLVAFTGIVSGSYPVEKTTDLQASIKKVEEVFKKYNPAYPFEYSFADVEFGKKFTTISMISRLASLFASLAIVITGLGLFGLAAFMAEQRTKEIGIRKVMGASVSSLVALMSKDFSRLVLIAFLISSPIAWWLLNQFLLRYPIRVSIPWWVFPLTGLVALVYATLIVSTQAFRAARANPANSLRNE